MTSNNTSSFQKDSMSIPKKAFLPVAQRRNWDMSKELNQYFRKVEIFYNIGLNFILK